MSNLIRYDSLLVRALADELHARHAGARLRAVHLDADRLRLTLPMKRQALVFDLHPDASAIRTSDAPAEGARLDLAAGTTIDRVDAPADERILRIGVGDVRIFVELIPNRQNAVVVDSTDRVLALLRERTDLRVGSRYALPESTGRAGRDGTIALEEWLARLRDSPAGERAGALVRDVAWTSPLNAAAILDGAGSLEAAYERYVEVVQARGAFLLGGSQPYPHGLWRDDAVPYGSLLDAMAAAAPAPAAEAQQATVSLLERRAASARRRIERIRAEAERARPEAARAREDAGLLLANLRGVPKGEAAVELAGWDGAPRRIELDPALTARANAERLFEHARRRERAAARAPELIDAAHAELARVEALLERARAGEPIALPQAPSRAGRAPAKRLPYRRYRTSGGLEVRVGRGSRDNDELTFHHSSPGDVWLHARDNAGSHVVLRWDRPDGSPPRRDLEEAAILAALHSRARTSGVVAVDWTRRKYVRKPRRSPPGRVVIERVQTLFVEPDAELEKRLRVDDVQEAEG